ncbi:hypothetical protein JBW_01230 [Pelosinus fermentans JBW45]|uniref:Uncharacterized protein n=1 Tax=Pelosinus fermentans JBW45 TaxID=1192197 RepID=A0A0C5QGM8_9FIRM|nr:hypothetical protein JBW_01230 [Pelosinus fermentans JBW45]
MDFIVSLSAPPFFEVTEKSSILIRLFMINYCI